MNIKKQIIMLFATGFYIGKIPVAPGTFGTIIGIPILLFFSYLSPSYIAICHISFIVFAIYISDQAESFSNQKDPGCIVIDEIAGYIVTMSMVPITIYTVISGFFIFRLLDILKPYPIKYFENNFSGGAGIVLDDVVAGILGALCLKMLNYLY